MGLDVHFYNRVKKYEKPNITDEDILKEFDKVNIEEPLLHALKQLKQYTDEEDCSFQTTLYDIISVYLNNYILDSYNDVNEVAYFRKFWWTLDFFGYSDEDYGKDKPITKEKLEEAKSLAEKTIKMVIKHFTDKGFEVEHSPLGYTGKTARWGGINPEYLTFKNGVLTDEMEEEADSICSSVFDCEDSYLFTKICELYVQFTEILRDTDFENEVIVMSADW